MKVIIVEDEPAIARGISKLLTINYPEIEVLDICFNGKDGADSILEKHPDLVFTDIRMPVMNGLELIRYTHEHNYYPHFVILTVYAEFEYAKTAMGLGITDYLLKPVDMDSLDKIVDSCRKRLHKTKILLQEDYLKKTAFFNLPGDCPEGRNPFYGYHCTFAILFSGSVCSYIYNETILHNQIQPADRSRLQEIEEQYHVSLIILPGHHYNECVYAIVSANSAIVDLKAICTRLYALHDNGDSILSMVVSDTCCDGNDLFSVKQNGYLYAMFHIKFGYGNLFFYKTGANKVIEPSAEIRQLCSALNEHLKKQKSFDYLSSMINFWKNSKVSQFQLVTDLRYFFTTLEQLPITDSQHMLSTADEIVCSCQTYPELKKEIEYELEQFFGYEDDFFVHDQHTLARQVKEWLDENFTTQITYKIFQDLFNLNEKYICTLFKAEYNITPSKYIGELRLNMAKNLMQNKPDIRLKDVAELVGFTDAYYFSRVFKAHEGLTPSQYIKKITSHQ